MKKALTFLLIASVLSGCGGKKLFGSSGESAYAGSYTGTFTNTSSQSGTLAFTVSDSGSVLGSIHNSTTSEDGTLTGSISDGGELSGFASYNSQTVTLAGPVTLSSGQLTGTVVQSVSGESTGTCTFTVKAQ